MLSPIRSVLMQANEDALKCWDQSQKNKSEKDNQIYIFSYQKNPSKKNKESPEKRCIPSSPIDILG